MPQKKALHEDVLVIAELQAEFGELATERILELEAEVAELKSCTEEMRMDMRAELLRLKTRLDGAGIA